MGELPAVDTRLLLTVPETAAMLGVSDRTVWRLIGQGELALVRCNRAARVTAESIERFIDRGGTSR